MTADPVILADRYALESRIARGGMAEVWRARDDVLARPVAVKMLLPRLAQDETILDRFKREALAAARLAHPNIVAIYDTGSDETAGDPKHYIVMEHCGRGSLEDLLRMIAQGERRHRCGGGQTRGTARVGARAAR